MSNQNSGTIFTISPEQLCNLAESWMQRLPYPVVTVSIPDYRYIFLNESALDVFRNYGIPKPESALGLHTWEVMPHWREVFLQVAETAKTTREIQYVHDVRYVTTSGRITYWDLVFLPNYDPQSRMVTSITLVGTDVTERKRTDELNTVLNEINTDINSTLDLDEIMLKSIQKACQAIDAQSAAVALRVNGKWEVSYIWGKPMEIIGYQFSDEESPCAAKARQSREPIRHNNLTCSGRFGKTLEKELGAACTLFAPMIVKNRVIGVLTFHWDSEDADLSPYIIDFTKKVAIFISLAMENAQLYHAQKESMEQEANARATLETILNTIPTGIIVADMDGKITHTSPVAERIFGAPMTGLIVSPRPVVFKFMHPDGTLMELEDQPLVLSLHKGIALSDVEILIARPDGKRMTIIVNTAPLYDSSGCMTGAVASITDITQRKHQEQELERNRKELEEALGREAGFSRMLQRALLPEKPYIGPGYTVSDIYVPAYTGREIGGDFYDVFETEDGKIGILIGDVSGKGIESASLAVATRSTVHAFAYDFCSAGLAVSHANSVVYSLIRTESLLFVTAFLVILDTLSGQLIYTSAGHPSPIILHKDGIIECLKHGQLAIGIYAKVEYSEDHSRLEKGGKIIFYTDGISEARRGGDMFGYEEIEKLLLKNKNMPPDGLRDSLLAAATDWAGGRLSDDAAIIVIERL